MVASSCVKKTSACIEGPEEVEQSASVKYTWCGSNADNIEWNVDGGGTVGTGNIFVTSFAGTGMHTIVAKGTNKKSEKSTTIHVHCGRTVRSRMSIQASGCVSPDLNNPSRYRAYIYQSKADWTADVKRSSHALADDSANAVVDQIYRTIYFEFKKVYPLGSKKVVSVEDLSVSTSGPSISNWNDILAGAGTIEMKNSGFVETLTDNSDGTVLDNFVKDFFKRYPSGKWKVMNKEVNYSPISLGCEADDYFFLLPDGSWTYDTGANDCNGNTRPGNGTYQFQSCGPDPYFKLPFVTLSGTFKVDLGSLYPKSNTMTFGYYDSNFAINSYTLSYTP